MTGPLTATHHSPLTSHHSPPNSPTSLACGRHILLSQALSPCFLHWTTNRFTSPAVIGPSAHFLLPLSFPTVVSELCGADGKLALQPGSLPSQQRTGGRCPAGVREGLQEQH